MARRTRIERGVFSSLTPKRDFSPEIEHLLSIGKAEAINDLCNVGEQTESRHIYYNHSTGRWEHGDTLGAYNDDESAYNAMWERISGMTMNEDGFLVKIPKQVEEPEPVEEEEQPTEPTKRYGGFFIP